MRATNAEIILRRSLERCVAAGSQHYWEAVLGRLESGRSK